MMSNELVNTVVLFLMKVNRYNCTNNLQVGLNDKLTKLKQTLNCVFQ